MNITELRKKLENLPGHATVSIELEGSYDPEDHITEFHVFPEYRNGGYTGEDADITKLVIFEAMSRNSPLATFRVLTRIGLPEEFITYCRAHDVSPTLVLYAFMADLAEIRNRPAGLNTNGSDERMYAQQWFGRVGWSGIKGQ